MESWDVFGVLVFFNLVGSIVLVRFDYLVLVIEENTWMAVVLACAVVICVAWL